MSEQILSILRIKLSDESISGLADPETRRNALKEELQYYVLNFIYHHPEYGNWVMYGGSALRICHDLDRMSVDLDFEISDEVTPTFLEMLKSEIESHFTSTYGTDPSFLTVKINTGRSIVLKFHVGKELSFGAASDQVHVKIDLNHFVTPKVVIERFPINHNQLSFVIVTYNKSALMASKLAAIFLRGTRGVGKDLYQEKGRDIYDLLWYMGKKTIPDFDYLKAKDVQISDPRTLFDKLTFQMNKVNNNNLRKDLLPLFANRVYIEHWLQNWLESYLKLVESYCIHTVTDLEKIEVQQDTSTDVFYFLFRYRSDGGQIRVLYALSDYWIDYGEGTIPNEVDKKVEGMIEFLQSGWSIPTASQEKLKRYATLFLQKTEDYFTKMKRVVLGDTIRTKVIRMTADKLNQKEQIVLTKSALLNCELDDLLK